MTTGSDTPNQKICPACGGKGKAVKPITVESLVDPEVRKNLSTPEGFRFCSSPSCHTAYFNTTTGETIDKNQVTVRIGQKETDPARPVCYCFGHTAESIRDELASTGGSAVFDEIRAKCKQGLDRCAQTNPQGACCLANVRAAVTEARADLGIADHAQNTTPADCCSSPCADTATQTPPLPTVPPTHKGLWASGGAVLAAAMASACCWLPLLLISFGVSAAGIGGFFEAYRPYLLAATVGLLAAGYYFVYRKPRCAPGEVCATAQPKLRRFNKISLGFATAMVLAFALFPNYLGLFLGGEGSASAKAPSAGKAGVSDVSPAEPVLVTAQLDIEGMTCAACATGLTSYLNSRPGVQSAAVDYETKTASVQLDSESGIDTVLKSISEYGFLGKVRQTP